MTTPSTESPRVRLGHGGGMRLTGESASDTRSTIRRLLAYLKPYWRSIVVVACPGSDRHARFPGRTDSDGQGD